MKKFVSLKWWLEERDDSSPIENVDGFPKRIHDLIRC